MPIKRRIAVILLATLIVLTGTLYGVNDSALASDNDSYDLLVMSSNVLFDDSYDTEYRMHCLLQTYLNYMPDVLCLQEARSNQTDVLFPFLADKYTPVNFAANESNPAVYQQILYRKDLYTVKEYGFKRFRENVIPWGVSWVVLQRNEDNKLFCVMSTHLSIISSTYDPGASNTVEGVILRQNDCRTILSAVDEVLAAYPDIPVIVGGDWNDTYLSPSLNPMDTSGIMVNAMKAAPVANTTVNTTHNLCKTPVKGGDIIDHFYVSQSTVDVFEEAVVVDGVVIQGSDHCPIFTKVAFK